MTALEGEKGGKSSARYTVLKQELASLGQAIKNADREIDTLSKDIADNQAKIKSYENNISNTSNAIQLLEKDLNDLKNSDLDFIPMDNWSVPAQGKWCASFN